MKNRRCLNPACTFHGRVGSGNIVRHGFYRTRSGRRRRYRRVRCGKTFSSTKGTPYYRLQHRRATFDTVVALRVEGVSISAIARVEGIAWNTVARWLEKAAAACRRFNSRRIAGYVVEELQADEIRSLAGRGSRLGSLLRSRCGPVSGPRPSSGVEATGTHSLSCATWPTGWIGSVFPWSSPTDSISTRRSSRSPSRLWSSGSVRPGSQDAQERSYREGRTKSAGWSCVAIR